MTVATNPNLVRDSSLLVDLSPGDIRSFDQRENLIQYSEQFDNAYWVKSNCVVTANAGMAPNGTITADAMTESTDASVQFHNVATGSVTLTAGNYYTMSVYVKGAGNFNTTYNGVEIAGLAGGANFNLNTQNINFNFGTTTASSITDVGNGWYYLTVTCLIATTTTYTMFVQLSTAIGNTNYQGTGALRLYVWGAQLERSSTATPYNQTVGSTFTRSTTYTNLAVAGSYNGTIGGNVVYDNTGAGSMLFNNTGTNTISLATIPDTVWNAGSWTLSVWFRPTVINRTQYDDNTLLSHGTTAVNNGLHIGERSRVLFFGMYGNDSYGVTPISANQWCHATFTFDYTLKQKQIFLNGVFDGGGGSVGYGGTGGNTELGRQWGGTTSNRLTGYLGRVQIYTRVLTASEIVRNFTSMRGRYGI